MAVIPDSFFMHIKARYKEALHLSNEESKNDPENLPYKSKYRAKDILQELEQSILTKVDSSQSNVELIKIEMIRAILNFEIGKMNLDTEELGPAEENFKICVEIVQDHALKRNCCIPAIQIYNIYGILLSKLGELQKAEEILLKAKCIYTDYIKDKLSEKPLNFEEIIYADVEHIENLGNDEKSGWELLEISHTYTLYYLAQVYEHLDKSDLSSIYLHNTLKKQLKHSDFDPMEWSINCAMLSEYFLKLKRYKKAKHYLICANHIFVKYKQTKMATLNMETDDNLENLRLLHEAKLARHWINYYLSLLNYSEKLRDSKNTHLEEENENTMIEGPEIEECETIIPSTIAKNYEDAKTIFFEAQKHIQQAKSVYTLVDYASEFINLTQQHSKLFCLLASYETDPHNACKMHKRRVDMLKPLLSQLNERYYMAYCRAIMYELGETFQTMMDLKLNIMEKEGNRTLHTVQKINKLICNSICYFLMFINSHKDQKTKALPATFPDELAQGILRATFYLGRLTFKLQHQDNEQLARNLKMCQKHYQFICEYVAANPQHSKYIEEEFKYLKEMMDLIEIRVQSLR